MARLNVYVPDELAERAKVADLNVSALAQAAIADELQRRATDAWLESLPTPRATVSHSAALKALDEARAEMAGGAADD
jgi:post-segregation antitoxin (ccd killing protein)